LQVLVIGLGNPDRGDDAVGVEVARQVAAERPDVTVLEFDDPSEAIDAWEPDDTVVVADAVSSGGHPGDIQRCRRRRAEAPHRPLVRRRHPRARTCRRR